MLPYGFLAYNFQAIADIDEKDLESSVMRISGSFWTKEEDKSKEHMKIVEIFVTDQVDVMSV